MLELHYCCEGIFVFDVNDWIFLRKEQRILGELVGNTNFVPTLPLKLLPEEALYLQETDVAKIVKCDYRSTEERKQFHGKFERDLFKNEEIVYREVRKKQLESMIDSIVEAKRKRGDERTHEEIFNDELEKSCKIIKDNMIWPIFLTPKDASQISHDVPPEILLKETTKWKLLIFKDLHQRGYYITSGHKFGGDFLVYLGDPVVSHAIFIVHCIENQDKMINPIEIVAFGRLGTSVRKKAVLASLDDNEKVTYLTISWIDDE